MIRAWLAILILTTGTTCFCSFRKGTTTARHELADREAAQQTVKRQIAKLYVEKEKTTELIKEAKVLLAAQPPLPPRQTLAGEILSDDNLKTFSADESEKVLAELGFNWNTTGDYIIVSKQSLNKITFTGMQANQLTAAAIGTLAISPAEQADIESATRQIGDARAAWIKEHVERSEPTGNVLAQYSLPVDEVFSQSQFTIFTNAIFDTLGAERARLLEDRSWNWMEADGLVTGPDYSGVPPEILSSMPAIGREPQPTTLTMEYSPPGNTFNLLCTLKQAGNVMSYGVSPRQPFPEAFRSLFPGGWRELAKREGFKLPAEFKQNPKAAASF